ncbi:MAG: AmmeMemoRadiSam system protein B [Bryobacterales bacterium]|nr:AmmeMemoRadiSam system protein B [Bryobacterales bacterium]
MSEGCHLSPYSGQWYPDDPEQLRELLGRTQRESVQRTGPFLLPSPLGFVVPHAGIHYSGSVAWSVYRAAAAAAPRRIVLFGFRHRGGPAGLAVPDIIAYRTPLGDLPVDQDVRDRLAAGGVFRRLKEALICDHSTEMQLPFLQFGLPGVPVVPVSVGHASAQELETASRVLAPLAGQGSLFVASSDFTHYGSAFRYRPFPPDDTISGRLRELDDELADAAGSLDDRLLAATVENLQSTLCGIGPMSLLLATLRQAASGSTVVYQQTLDYQTSGERTGDYQHSVSYCALGYYPQSSFALPTEATQSLLQMAFGALKQAIAGGGWNPVETEVPPHVLQARLPVFVTLYAGGRLRGCIGSCFDPRPLGHSIPELTLAALHDDRFPPIGLEELDSVEVEISLLTPFRRIGSQQQWQAGVHGSMLRYRQHRGILLPQVAGERNWDRTQFFSALARKAGCPADVYSRPECRLFVFQSQTCRERYTGVE